MLINIGSHFEITTDERKVRDGDRGLSHVYLWPPSLSGDGSLSLAKEQEQE
jgi:hypothetical protein